MLQYCQLAPIFCSEEACKSNEYTILSPVGTVNPFVSSSVHGECSTLLRFQGTVTYPSSVCEI